jgi:undecaprenyl-diphosphatase
MSSKNVDRTSSGRLGDHPLVEDHPVAWRIALLLWIFSALLFAAVAIPALLDIVQTVDDVVHGWAVSTEWGTAVTVAKVLDFVGSVWVTFPVIVVVAVWLIWRRRWEALAAWVVAMVVSQVFIGPIKDLYMRPRPPDALVETSSWSFPSGHSVAGAAISIALVIVLVPAGPKRRNLEMLAAAFAVLMALSRVYLRAHWLSDVTAGAALGAGIAVGSAALIHWLDDVREARATQETDLG